MNFKYVFLDAGHGGIKNGEYTTAPSKMFDHKKGTFHDGSKFYEGVKNRKAIDLIEKKLLEDGKLIPIKVYQEKEDTALYFRSDLANRIHKIRKGFYFSEHSNATPQHTARGFSVWTSVGQTDSDVFASLVYDLVKEKLSSIFNIKMMKQTAYDEDADYEAKFHVLVRTSCPSLLVENLFFDNFEDAKILMNEEYLSSYAEAVVEAMYLFADYLNRKYS